MTWQSINSQEVQIWVARHPDTPKCTVKEVSRGVPIHFTLLGPNKVTEQLGAALLMESTAMETPLMLGYNEFRSFLLYLTRIDS